MAEPTHVRQWIDQLETKDFWLATSIASGWNTVWDVLRSSEEVRWLAAHGDQSVPMIVQRIRTRQIADPVLIAYFAVLAEADDRQAIPVLIDYLESLHESERMQVGSLMHPFIYAVLALDKIARIGVFETRPMPSATDLFVRRSDILACAREKYRHERPAPGAGDCSLQEP